MHLPAPANSQDFCTSGIITTLFFASGIRHHLPNLCSCPTAAIKKRPSGVNTRELINPDIFILNKGCKLLNDSPHFHKLIFPFLEPVTEVNLFLKN